MAMSSPIQAPDFKEEVSDGNISADDGKTAHPHPFPHRRKESSVKSKSIIKHGHLRVKEDGQKVYKKTPSQAIMSATQLGIGFSVGRLSATKERDILMVDFDFVEKVWFPSAGTKETPSHKHNDFRFKAYAPLAFRYFRDLFGIQPSDFLLSLANEPIREISNPGASGSLFFLSNDDTFIVKTVQHKEATFLQQLLPGYYMNIHQNPRTLLPKFFGLYCYQSGTSNIRLIVMNNLLPSKYKCHQKFDLKGSSYKRKANKEEREKKSPTWKDLDFQQQFPNGVQMDAETYDTVIKTISRDVRVLESFNIMDYSFLLGIHNIDESKREKEANMLHSPSQEGKTKSNPDRIARTNEFGAALEAIPRTDDNDEIRPFGGVPARNDKGERLILFMGIIDILQSYRLTKKLEHRWKAILTDGDTVSVHKPSFYSLRFLTFIKDKVFSRSPMQRTNSKRRPLRTSQYGGLKGEIIPNKSETSIMETNVNTAKTNKVVTIVEPERSFKNGSVDNTNETDYNGIEINMKGDVSDNKFKNVDDVSASNNLIESDDGNVQVSNTEHVTEISNNSLDNNIDVSMTNDIVDINDIYITPFNGNNTNANTQGEKNIENTVKIEVNDDLEMSIPILEDSNS